MNKVKFTNFLQLKIIEEKYNISSLYDPIDFGKSLLDFISKGGPQKLRKALEEHDDVIEWYQNEKDEYTHEEFLRIKQILETQHGFNYEVDYDSNEIESEER
jgi:hypothetical protein